MASWLDWHSNLDCLLDLVWECYATCAIEFSDSLSSNHCLMLINWFGSSLGTMNNSFSISKWKVQWILGSNNCCTVSNLVFFGGVREYRILQSSLFIPQFLCWFPKAMGYLPSSWMPFGLSAVPPKTEGMQMRRANGFKVPSAKLNSCTPLRVPLPLPKAPRDDTAHWCISH